MWEAGQVIKERYQLREKFSNNPGRQTWLAQDLASETSELVIVKLLTFGGNIQWDEVKLFEREGQILQQLNHDRIPKYKNYFSIDDSTLWFGLVEEYISGNSLKQLLAKGTRFGEADIIKIAQEVLHILVYLHSLNPPVLHRDIKPSNLLLGDDNKIYLVDFGAVQDSFAAEGMTFTVVGTYGYASLEQFSGRTVPASDLYALGVTLIHLLTRTAPSNLPTRDVKIQFRYRVTVSPQLTNWLDKMIAPAVEKRFTNATSALKYLLPGNSQELAQLETNYSDAKFVKGTNVNPRNKPVNSNLKINKDVDAIQIIIVGGIILLFWEPLMMTVILIIFGLLTILIGPFLLISELGVYYFVFHFISAILSAIVAQNKGYDFARWLVYGWLFAIFTLIRATFLSKKELNIKDVPNHEMKTLDYRE